MPQRKQCTPFRPDQAAARVDDQASRPFALATDS
jgi:hypothetical protein